jgi:hypothetical protein
VTRDHLARRARDGRQIARQIDIVVRRGGRHRHRRGRIADAFADERAAPDLARNESAPLGLGIGARDRADGHVQAPGKIAMRGQAVARFEPPARYVDGKLVGHREIARAATGGDFGKPIGHGVSLCYGDNVFVDPELCQ